MTTVPLEDACQRYQTERPPAAAWTGSPGSDVAPALLPERVGLLPARTTPAEKASLSGGGLTRRVSGPLAPLLPSTAMKYVRPAVARKVVRLAMPTSLSPSPSAGTTRSLTAGEV